MKDPKLIRQGVGLRSERGPILAALMMTIALVALDSTIIATAVPSIVLQLGGFSQFPWLFSIYLLTQAVTVPLYGKFADVIGRKPILYFGIALFLLGSIFCGIAWSMPMLIIARALQGLGAGAVQPTVLTVVGDLYTVKERARVQGYTASVWAISSVAGPALGGLFTQYLSWRWIFFINLPIGALAYWMLRTRFVEKVERREHTVDYLGAALLASGCSMVILGLLEGGVAWKWISPIGIGIELLGLLLLLFFVWIERRVAEPILPLWVFSRRILVAADLAGAGAGAVMIGLTAYIPTFAQGVLGARPIMAGLAVATLVLGWPLASSNSGRLYLRIGFRNTALIGTSILIGGTVFAARLAATSSIWQVAFSSFVVGIGMGFSVTPAMVAVQSVVSWNRRGIVTATNMFSRSIGSAIGVAIFGAVANITISHELSHPPRGLAGLLPTSVDGANRILEKHSSGSALVEFVRSALFHATHHVLISVALIAVVTLGAVALLPKKTEKLEFPDDVAADSA
jgi:EmrB/QacA subfamily drug resistance transporter